MSRLKSAHDLSGLMKYADRAPWDEAMDEMLSAHLGPACEATGLEPDAIFEIIGDHWQGPLWGCAFDDLLTQELEPDGRNLVDDYLKRRGWNEKAPNKAYMGSGHRTGTDIRSHDCHPRRWPSLLLRWPRDQRSH